MKFLFLLFLELCGVVIYSQPVSGLIIDADSKAALEYVNIGVIGKRIGTVCDENGRFSLDLSEQYNDDTLRISFIGYYPVNYRVEDFRRVFKESVGGFTIGLSKKTSILSEVAIKTHVVREKKIGTKGGLGSVEFISDKDLKLGTEIGTVIKLAKGPAFIKDVNFVLNFNDYSDSILFRVNIYSMKGKMPGENILAKPIYIYTNAKKGVLVANLEEYNVYVEDDFMVSLEWIQEKGEKKIRFGLGTKGYGYMRVTSQAPWDEFPTGFAFGFFANVSYVEQTGISPTK